MAFGKGHSLRKPEAYKDVNEVVDVVVSRDF